MRNKNFNTSTRKSLTGVTTIMGIISNKDTDQNHCIILYLLGKILGMPVLTLNSATVKTDILALLEAMQMGRTLWGGGVSQSIQFGGLCNLATVGSIPLSRSKRDLRC